MIFEALAGGRSKSRTVPIAKDAGPLPIDRNGMMSAKKMKSPERWTVEVPDEATRLRGSEDCSRKAVEKLGPFKHRLHADAARLGPWGGVGGGIPLSEELAIEHVRRLATAYNRQTHLEHGAPRSKSVADALTKLETLAGDLARHLASLDDLTRHCLQTAGTGVGRYRDYIDVPLMEAADVAGLPTPGARNERSKFRWVERLESLSQYANATQGMFLAGKGVVDADAPDKGGNTNLYKDLCGSARRSLVQQGWHTHELFKPGTSTGTDGGPFHLFLLDVFEYATGLAPEEHAKLSFWLKKVCGPHRRMKELREREDALGEELNSIEPTQANQERFAALYAEQEAVEREIYEIWPSLYPFSYPAKNAGK
jgi:hypothetical protein